MAEIQNGREIPAVSFLFLHAFIDQGQKNRSSVSLLHNNLSKSSNLLIARSAGAVEHTDCFSVEG